MQAHNITEAEKSLALQAHRATALPAQPVQVGPTCAVSSVAGLVSGATYNFPRSGTPAR